MSIAPNWSDDLPEDLIISVAKRPTDLEDFIFFGAVCKSWRLAAMEVKKNCLTNTIRLRLLTHQVPLLMLPIIFMRNRSNLILSMNKKVEFYNLGKGKMSYKLNLPRTCTSPKTKMRMCFSSFGWLVAVSKLAKGYKWNLLHPLNHAKIELPDGRARFGDYIVDTIQKFALSSSPSWTVDFIVMFHSSNCLGFCRPGLGENWTRINLWTQTSSERPLIMDLSYYKGQFYFVYLSGCISVFDIDKAEIRVVAPEFPKAQLLGPNVCIREQYLVESAGDLLLVLCTTNMNDLLLTTGYRVFEVPFTNSKSWLESEVKSLGNKSIFLSKSSSSFSIEESDYSTCMQVRLHLLHE